LSDAGGEAVNDELKQRQILQAERLAAQAAAYRDRRERIATAALAGMLANPNVDPWRDKVAVDAVALADALIAELDKEVKP
jgi:hypothetical protein